MKKVFYIFVSLFLVFGTVDLCASVSGPIYDTVSVSCTHFKEKNSNNHLGHHSHTERCNQLHFFITPTSSNDFIPVFSKNIFTLTNTDLLLHNIPQKLLRPPKTI